MNKAPEQIWVDTRRDGGNFFHTPLDSCSVNYTRTDVAQATYCAAIGYAAEQLAERGADAELVNAVLAATSTDARAALDRIVQEAVKEALASQWGHMDNVPKEDFETLFFAHEDGFTRGFYIEAEDRFHIENSAVEFEWLTGWMRPPEVNVKAKVAALKGGEA